MIHLRDRTLKYQFINILYYCFGKENRAVTYTAPTWTLLLFLYNLGLAKKRWAVTAPTWTGTSGLAGGRGTTLGRHKAG